MPFALTIASSPLGCYFLPVIPRAMESTNNTASLLHDIYEFITMRTSIVAVDTYICFICVVFFFRVTQEC